MALPNQQNKQQDSVNTNGFQFFNKDSESPSTMRLRLWNQQMVLQMHPAKEPSKQTKDSVYDYEKTTMITFPPAMGKLLAYEAINKLIPALQKGEECTIGFPVGNSVALNMSTGVKKHGKVHPYIAILKDIKPNTLIAEETMHYYFNGAIVLDGYDGTADSIVGQSVCYNELIYFIDAIGHISEALIGAEHHARRFVNKRFDDNVFALYKNLGDHIGKPFYGETAKTRSNYSGNSPWNSLSAPKEESYPANTAKPINEVASFDDLNEFM